MDTPRLLEKPVIPARAESGILISLGSGLRGNDESWYLEAPSNKDIQTD